MARLETFEFVTRRGVRLPFTGTLSGWNFEVSPQFGEHSILYRSGVIHQWQGQGARRFGYTCILREPGASEAFKNIEQALAAEPFGRLIDPRFGAVNAFFTGPLRSTESPNESLTTKTFEIDFSETNLRTVPQDTPSAAAAAASQASTALGAKVAAAAMADYRRQAAQAAAVSSAVQAFGAAVQDAALTQMELDSALAQVKAAVDTFIGMVGLEVAQADLVAQARLTFGRCLMAYNLSSAGALQMVTRRVDEMISLTRWCASIYGGGAQAVEDQILALNRIKNPLRLQPGAQLLIPDPAGVTLPAVVAGGLLQAVANV